MEPEARPTLIYDGHCGFCKIWIRYWQQLTGESVIYAASQDVAASHPEISAEEFKRSVWLVHPDGRRTSGAHAVFELMTYTSRGWSDWPLALYRRVPGVAGATEAIYRQVAQHRNIFYWVTRIFWGKQVEPSSHSRVRSVLLGGIAFVYLIAFLSMLPQVVGLVGERGILPVSDYLNEIRAQFGTSRYWLFPTLSWVGSPGTELEFAL